MTRRPGTAKGNGLNLSGGLWYEMTVSGAKPATGTTASTSASTGGGGAATERGPGLRA